MTVVPSVLGYDDTEISHDIVVSSVLGLAR